MDIEKLTASIKHHEGLRLKPYNDSVGKITIGYGRNLTNVGISQEEAETLLSNDIQSAIGKAKTLPWWSSVYDNDARARAFTEIGFNIGFGAMAKFSRALDAASRNDWNTCAAEFLNSLWAAQVGKRAETLASMIMRGTDDQKDILPSEAHSS